MTGYQMRKIYERSLGHFWSESYSTSMRSSRSWRWKAWRPSTVPARAHGPPDLMCVCS